MFQAARRRSDAQIAFAILELVFHTAANKLRSQHRNALMSLLQSMLQTLVFVGVFYAMYEIMGARSAAVRGDFVLYLMSGIIPFMCHLQAFSQVRGAKGPTDPMMLHTPMNTAVSILAGALSALYTNVFTVIVLLGIYQFATGNVTIADPLGAVQMYLLAWFSGACIGVCFMALGIFLPTFTGILSTVYRRINMIGSGKMFVVNTLPSIMLAMFDWNPLFHIIDQLRGYVFINYTPHFTSAAYAMKVSCVMLLLGMMGEFSARRWASSSRNAGR